MKIKIKNIIEFFDQKGEKGDATAIVSVLGEEINAAVYKHYRENDVDILENPVTQGTRSGKWLDRWIVDKKTKTLWQCEIKNWSAAAIGGRRLKVDDSQEEIKKVVRYYWEKEFKDGGNLSKNPKKKHEHPNGVSKVFIEMNKPDGYEDYKVEPLLIYWMPISSDFTTFNSLSTVSIKKLDLPIETPFVELHIFSASLYLRHLYKQGETFIELEDSDMNVYKRRVKLMTGFMG